MTLLLLASVDWVHWFHEMDALKETSIPALAERVDMQLSWLQVEGCSQRLSAEELHCLMIDDTMHMHFDTGFYETSVLPANML